MPEYLVGTTWKSYQILCLPRLVTDDVEVLNLKAWGDFMGRDLVKGELQGLLGLDILANYGALIDLYHSKLWFRPAKQVKSAPR